jgi:hypothetical protein
MKDGRKLDSFPDSSVAQSDQQADEKRLSPMTHAQNRSLLWALSILNCEL